MNKNEKMSEPQDPKREHKVVPRDEWLAGRLLGAFRPIPRAREGRAQIFITIHAIDTRANVPIESILSVKGRPPDNWAEKLC
jgi:hypothetical protein